MSKLGIDFAPSHNASRTVTIGRAEYQQLLLNKFDSIKELYHERAREIDEWENSPERLVEAKRLAAVRKFRNNYEEMYLFLLERELYPNLSLINKIKWKYFTNYRQKVEMASYSPTVITYHYPESEASVATLYKLYQDFTGTTLSFDEFATQELQSFADRKNVDIPTAVRILDRSGYNSYADGYHVLNNLLESIDKVEDVSFTIAESEFLGLTK